MALIFNFYTFSVKKMPSCHFFNCENCSQKAQAFCEFSPVLVSPSLATVLQNVAPWTARDLFRHGGWDHYPQARKQLPAERFAFLWTVVRTSQSERYANEILKLVQNDIKHCVTVNPSPDCRGARSALYDILSCHKLQSNLCGSIVFSAVRGTILPCKKQSTM